MPQFRYQALNAKNQPIAGEILADSVAHAISQLEAAGLMVQSIGFANGEHAAVPTIQPAASDFPTLTAAERTTLDARLEKIVDRGRALVPALSAYAAELPPSLAHRRLQAFLRILQSDDNSQAAASLARQPAQWIPLLNSATTASDHAQLLNALLYEYDPSREPSRRGRGWLVYPIVVACFAIAVFLFIGIFVVPVFRDVFAGFGLKLPALTQFVLAFYDSITSGTFFVVATVIVIVGLIVSRIAAAAAPNEIGNGSARSLNRSTAVAKFVRNIADLLDADLSSPSALRLASSAVARPRLKQAAFRVAAALERGGDHPTTADRRTVTSSVLYALQAGVPNSARSAMLRELSRCYEDRARIAFSWSEGLVGPFAIVVIGFLVAMTVIGLYLPLLTLIQAIT